VASCFVPEGTQASDRFPRAYIQGVSTPRVPKFWFFFSSPNATPLPNQISNRYRRPSSSPRLQRVCSLETPLAITTTHPQSCPVPLRGHTSPFSATSEGESYLRFARATGLLPSADTFTRVTIEDAALDSFQNVLFSIARFRELTGVYPTRITVVGHDFKRRRFEGLHRLALRWPKLRFTYEGVPLGSEADEREAATGEVRFSNFRTISVSHLSIVLQLANAFSPYSKDLYGCHAHLSQKRAGRNFHMRTHGYHVGAPELRELLEWCPKDGIHIFPGTLPWGKE
jgi:hypothetical protein